MTNKICFLLILLVSAHSAFSQNNASDKRPQAYLIGSGNTRPATSRPRFTTVAAIDTKPIFKSERDYSLEREVFNLINKQRVQMGLTNLEWNDDVARMARLHSENMANFKFFSHTDLKGLMVNDRADECGIKRWRAIGENIAYNRGYDDPAASAVEKWMQSPGHRENLLSNRWKESGIGVAVTNDGTYYFTEVFLVRK